MKAKVDHEICIGCGVCAGICSEVFEIKDDGLAHVVKELIPENLKNCTIEAESNCPVEAISHED